MAGLSDHVQALLMVAAFTLIAVGAIMVPSGFPELGTVVLFLGILGAGLKEVLGSSGKGKLTDNEQAGLMIFSVAAIATGALSFPVHPLLGLVVLIVGAAGVGVKEYLGSA